MVRIDHLSPEQYLDLPARERDLLIEQPDMPCPLASSSSEEEEAEDDESDDSEENSEQDSDEWPTQEESDSWMKKNRQQAKDAEESHCYVSTRRKTRFPRRNYPAAVL